MWVSSCIHGTFAVSWCSWAQRARGAVGIMLWGRLMPNRCRGGCWSSYRRADVCNVRGGKWLRNNRGRGFGGACQGGYRCCRWLDHSLEQLGWTRGRYLAREGSEGGFLRRWAGGLRRRAHRPSSQVACLHRLAGSAHAACSRG